jgi:aminotransferase
VFAPSFVSYEPLAQLTGANVIIVHTQREDEFKVTPELLEKHLTPNTKAMILSYPNNPTGAVMSLDDYKLLTPQLEAYQGIIVTDEIYGELTYNQEHASLAMIPSLKDKVVYINGFSKAYSMTGWRLGYVCAPTALLDPMIVIHQYSLMCAPTVSQFAGIEALRNGEEGIAMMKEQYALRQHYLVKRLFEMGLNPFPPQGAFYVFVDVRSTGLSSDQFCEKLLRDQHVAIIPGNAFGQSGEGYVRISYSYSLDHLKIALDKIEQFLINLK